MTLRERLVGGPDRVVGLDVARGLAVLGMFVAHVGVAEGPTTWLEVADGRSSVLFALVAGVSLALVTGGARPLTGDALIHARTRVLVRAVLLLALVALLDLLGTRVLLILGFYAAYFVLALPFLRWGPGRLAVAAGVVAVVGPPIAYWGPEVLARAGLRAPHDGSGAATDFLLTGHYPAVVWMAYVFAGMAIGRCDLTSSLVRTRLVVGGLAATALGYLASGALVGGVEPGAIEDQVATTSSRYVAEPYAWGDAWPTGWFLAQAEPHDNTFFEVVGSGGFAVAVLGLCLFARRTGAVALSPLAATGAMALTVYSLQIVAIWHWDLVGTPTNGPLLVMVAVTLVAATAWRLTLGRGPLERLFAVVALRTAPPPRPETATSPEPTPR
ncbi:heparan-alpha-glucosaminide N-acetyltransferase domain-containing protein [Isoptericola jiangsuensis]|uniref:heparan-alpha-glucosaminide N-acetyltransferase domain-containing protein n=1 Tax=Isoptericola jiangsuensis TaxID=548579 RepID=UPI003AAFC5C4